MEDFLGVISSGWLLNPTYVRRKGWGTQPLRKTGRVYASRLVGGGTQKSPLAGDFMEAKRLPLAGLSRCHTRETGVCV